MADKEEELEFPAYEDGEAADDIKAEEASDEMTGAPEEELEEKIEEALEEAGEDDGDEKVAELEKRYMSLFAEYENFRRRSAKEKEDLYAQAIATVTKDFLSVIDNIERAQEAGKTADENTLEKVRQGIDLIGKQAADVLAKLGVTEIECGRGTKFDPNLHEAVMHVEDEELGEQEVAQVFQKGYIYRDRVVRHAVVQVAN